MELVADDNCFATTLSAPGCSGHQTGARSFLNQVTLELPKGAEQVKHQPAAWSGGVDCLGDGAETDPPLFQSRDRLKQMRQRSTKAI